MAAYLAANMRSRIHSLLKSKWFAALCLMVITGIVLCAFFFQQELEAYLGWGIAGLFLGCFLSNATVLLPAPSLVLVCQFSLIYGILPAATVGSVASALGEMVGFFAGLCGKELLPGRGLKRISAIMAKHPYVVVFAFSIIPWPLFDIVGIISGALQIDWKRFYLACWLGKFIKMLVYGLVFAYVVGEAPGILNEVS